MPYRRKPPKPRPTVRLPSAIGGTRIRGGGGRFGSSKGFFSTSTLERGLAQFEIKMVEGMDEIARDLAEEMLAYAKANAPWTDRTGEARAGLGVEVESGVRQDLVVTLFHTMSYGVWLEVRWGGKYAIILPTVEKFGPELLDKMQHMMSRIIFYE